MQITMLQGKIHRATVTQAELDYVGSITVDEDLLDAAGIREYQMVQIVDVHNCRRKRQRRYVFKWCRSKMCQCK